ncbi:MAG TPA: TetR/AcrR family transcriptional regulator [Streptosporangiaceae bacterium]|nr:TetR/AcrR family transcriptional regulator [Streptosporangiaceae bacterium]
MSRARIRPTRDETRQRLFDAAAQVFESQGIGAASIEAIAEAAGFTRGAFYSNFASKDELIIAMLADHADRSARRNLALLARYRDPVDFVAALRTAEPDSEDPLDRSPLLHMEVILYVTRAPVYRPELAKRLRARRAVIAEIITATNQASGPDSYVDPSWATMLLALEDGYRLHRLIDPATTPEDSFLQAVQKLQQLAGLDQPS